MRLLVLLALLCTTAATASDAPPPPALTLEAAADQAMASTRVPGLAIQEIRDGRLMPEIVRGVRAADRRDRVRAGDSWHLGSNGKPITTTLIATLVERGKLRWDSRLGDLLPELAATMRPAYHDVTVADLASHRSGLAGKDDVPLVKPFYDDRRPLPVQRTVFVRQVLSLPPAQPRGTYAYSNRGFIVLGAIAERVGGAPVERLLRDLVFRPLGLRTATFGPTRRGQPLGHEAGRPVLGVKQDNPPFWTTAGTIRMSMADWGRWAIDQIDGEAGWGKLLPAAGYRHLHAIQIAPPGRRTAVALDLGVRQEAFGRLLTHSGSNGDWYAVVLLAPDIRAGLLVAANAAEDMGGDKAMDPPGKTAMALGTPPARRGGSVADALTRPERCHRTWACKVCRRPIWPRSRGRSASSAPSWAALRRR